MLQLPDLVGPWSSQSQGSPLPMAAEKRKRESRTLFIAPRAAPVGSEVPSYFEALLLDEIVFGPEERLALLRWCTGSTECR